MCQILRKTKQIPEGDDGKTVVIWLIADLAEMHELKSSDSLGPETAGGREGVTSWGKVNRLQIVMCNEWRQYRRQGDQN